MNYKLVLEYDGTDYYGWQYQPDVPTIQGELGKALKKLLKAPFKIIGASRTDRGVHARGQVANVQTPARWRPEELRRAINAHLPKDIYVREIRSVHPAFHARFWARGKVYTYRVVFGRSPTRRRYAWEFLYPPPPREELERMADALVGRWDGRGFSPGHEGDSEVLIVRARWEFRGDEAVFRVEGRRFLYRMVRNMVGAMLLAPEDFWRALRGEEARVLTAPPQGLCLEEVYYEDFH